MEELKIFEYQAKNIENTLRLCANTLNAHDKKTCLDRDIMEAWETIKNVINKQPEKRVKRY